MKIHYLSDHAILEYDEVKLFTEMGHEVFSNGAYLDPAGHFSLPRPGIPGAKYYEEYAQLARSHPAKTDLPVELLDPFDCIIIMHQPDVVVQNWPKLRGRNVIWRSIGQSVPGIERKLAQMHKEGLKIVRYSPKESNIQDYIGHDEIIRFYKDPEEYKGWTGKPGGVINFTQSLKGRRDFCHYDEIMPVIKNFEGKVYGPGNNDLGPWNGGEVTATDQVRILQQSSAVVYGGTWPASYTLSFIEALMTGTPIVAGSKAVAHSQRFQPIDFYEVDEMLAQIGGIVCDTVGQMLEQTQRLVDDEEHAKTISEKQRQLAINLFGKSNIRGQWEQFLAKT
jgi:hypothetical protein